MIALSKQMIQTLHFTSALNKPVKATDNASESVLGTVNKTLATQFMQTLYSDFSSQRLGSKN